MTIPPEDTQGIDRRTPARTYTRTQLHLTKTTARSSMRPKEPSAPVATTVAPTTNLTRPVAAPDLAYHRTCWAA
jgi:hypothetical protein